jgi:hypothetical protein
VHSFFALPYAPEGLFILAILVFSCYYFIPSQTAGRFPHRRSAVCFPVSLAPADETELHGTKIAGIPAIRWTTCGGAPWMRDIAQSHEEIHGQGPEFREPKVTPTNRVGIHADVTGSGNDESL